MSHNHDTCGDPLACPRNLAQEGYVPPPEKKCTKETDEKGNVRLEQDIHIPLTGEVADIEKLIDHDGYMGVFSIQVEML
jgi:hypothetical protein